MVSEKKGEAQSEPDLPIDIHCDKIIEWLESRGKLTKQKWQEDIKALRIKMEEASSDLPDTIKPIVKGSGVTYFTIVKVLGMLVKAKTESGANVKNIFGSYSDATLKTWDDLIKQYKKNNIYLGEAGRQMIRNMHNEIPTLRKTLETNDRQIKDLRRKIAESKANSKKAQEKYLQDCANLSIDTSQNKDTRTQLTASLSQLSSFLVDLHSAIHSTELGAVIDFYKEFVKYTLSKSKPDMDIATHSNTLLPVLTQLRSIPVGMPESNPVTLDKTENRYHVGSELLELSGFLHSRGRELNASKALTGSLFQGAPTVVRQHDGDKVQKFISVVEGVEGKLKQPRLQQLLMIRKSNRYVDRLVLSLDASIKSSNRYLNTAKEQEGRLDECNAAMKMAGNALTKTINATKELKQSMEEVISQEFGGKKVNIFGDITAL